MVNCRCPYCGKEISYVKALNVRRQGEYYCNKCKKESNVLIKKTIWVLFIAMLVFALVIMGFYLLMTNRENPVFILLVFVPFLVFYLFSPIFVRLRPKKKFQDSLYDTEMVNTTKADPDPTMAKTAKVAPAFVDDIVLGDDDYKPAINSDVFNAIKEERKIVEETDGGTKPFDKYENISGSSMGSTRPVGDLKSIGTEPLDPDYDVKKFK